MSPRSIVLLLAAFLFTVGFAIASAFVGESSGHFGAPLSFGYWSLWGGSFDPIAFIIDVLISALLMTGSWRLGGTAGVGICLAVSTLLGVMTLFGYTAGIGSIRPFVVFSEPAVGGDLALPVLWAGSLLGGTLAAFAARFLGRFRVII